jgi:cytoskeletal protein CcmA (bactofilin family)
MICYKGSVDSNELLHITNQLKLKGDLTCVQSVHLSTQYHGRIRTKKNLLCDKSSLLQGGIRSQTLYIEPGAKVNAEVQIGTRIPLWLKNPFSLVNLPSSDE